MCISVIEGGGKDDDDSPPPPPCPPNLTQLGALGLNLESLCWLCPPLRDGLGDGTPPWGSPAWSSCAGPTTSTASSLPAPPGAPRLVRGRLGPARSHLGAPLTLIELRLLPPIMCFMAASRELTFWTGEPETFVEGAEQNVHGRIKQ